MVNKRFGKLKKTVFLLFIFSALLVSIYLAVKPTKFWGRAFGVPANLVIDAGSSFDVGGRAWRNLAQGGEENARMLACCIRQISVLGAEYIRIDHVFDYYGTVFRGSDGKINFNWTRLDETLGDIRSAGAIPFVAISYMPPVISSGGVNDIPSSWSEWEEAVKALIEHISAKGPGGFDNVYYEVWNEPDLFGNFKTAGDKNYLDLYLHTARAAATASGIRSFKLGGPATTGAYEKWMKALLNFASKNNLRIDFVSWHRYSKNLSDYEDDWANVKKWLDNYPQYRGLELVISEVGPNSENDQVYDNFFSAVHQIAVSALLENKVNRIFAFEIKDGPGSEKYWGRWGMLTSDKWGAVEEKPRYKAIGFLNKMVGNKVNVAGQGSWVKAFAKEESGKIRLLVVNYDPQGKHYEAVPITLTNLPFKKFAFERIDFSGGGNMRKLEVNTASWQTTEGFEANTAAIFEITPL